jgi:hypothetical protein
MVNISLPAWKRCYREAFKEQEGTSTKKEKPKDHHKGTKTPRKNTKVR